MLKPGVSARISGSNAWPVTISSGFWGRSWLATGALAIAIAAMALVASRMAKAVWANQAGLKLRTIVRVAAAVRPIRPVVAWRVARAGMHAINTHTTVSEPKPGSLWR